MGEGMTDLIGIYLAAAIKARGESEEPITLVLNCPFLYPGIGSDAKFAMTFDAADGRLISVELKTDPKP